MSDSVAAACNSIGSLIQYKYNQLVIPVVGTGYINTDLSATVKNGSVLV